MAAYTKIENGVLFYYGTPAGYIDEETHTAVVDVAMRCVELENWLRQRRLDFRWSPGIFERLTRRLMDEKNAVPLFACRVWQLKADTDVEKKFIPHHRAVELFGGVSRADYEMVYDGQPKTNHLDELYTWLKIDPPKGFRGHSLAMSDLIELYDHEESHFYYIDKLGFCPVFEEEKES